MAKPGDKIRIPLPEKRALAGLLQVKPTADMPKRTPPAKRRKASKKPVR